MVSVNDSLIDMGSKLNPLFKRCLEVGFKEIYLEVVTEENKDGSIKNSMVNFLEESKIKRKKDSIFENINSLKDIEIFKDEIFRYYNNFINNFNDYFERVENKIDEQIEESFFVLIKTLKNRKKKLESSLKKFKIEDNWNVDKIKIELYFKMRKILEDIVSVFSDAIIVGLRSNNAYNQPLKHLNEFLEGIGIYTYDSISLEKKPTDEEEHFLRPIEGENCETKDMSKKNMIKEIIHYPYLIDINKEKQVLVEGNVVFWKKI